jgi:hypothetical protein
MKTRKQSIPGDIPHTDIPGHIPGCIPSEIPRHTSKHTMQSGIPSYIPKTKPVSFRNIPVDVYKKLYIIAIRDDKSVEKAAIEAFEEYVEKHG